MSDSSLSFSATKNFRDALLVRNLKPYNIPGYFSSGISDPAIPTTISDYSVVDSPNEIIIKNPFVDQLYPLNRFGPDGGYSKDISYNNPPLPVVPNQGPYDVMDAGIPVVSEFFLESAFVKNIYGPEGGYNENYQIAETQNNNHIYLPYWEPPVFRPSSYSPYAILISDNPAGSDGSLSLDSYIVQFAAKELQLVLKYRAALSDNTSVELISDRFAFSQPSSVSNQLRGNIITPNNDFRITLPADTDTFLTRLQGVYYPSSPIPGDYFQDEQSTRSTGSIGQLINVFAGRSTLLGDILGPAVSRVINPSIVILSATGAGQKSALFENLSYNRYKPQYGSTALGGIAQNLLTTGINAILNSTGTQLPGDFYVGSVISDPSYVESPVRDVPIDAFGKETGAIVYGPSEMSILYEGNESDINFGLQAVSVQDGGGIMGSFVWTSPKYQQNAGFIAGPGGEMIRQDSEFNQLNSDFEKNKSTNINFKVGSILDETQRLIESADRTTGLRRLRHVGNAINQVSKVFNDGYKELTKGSKVVLYKSDSGQESGAEYCRVFAKDTPYYTYNDLQKKDGNIRKFSYSVLDKTFNLNIAPLKGNNSTNIINNSVKKYMFSIENLAWKFTNKSGLRWDDLPVCERGPNRGRIMWFPPYDIKFSEQSSANFNPTTFLGRPEPIYTYKDTNRSGTLSWKIIVDHPSILNVVVNKVLANERNRTKLNDIVDSFFAGCQKYDIYDLAARYNTIPTKDLEAYQEMLSDPRLTREQLSNVNNAIPKDGRSEQNADITSNNETNVNDLQTFVNLGFYFIGSQPSSASVYSPYVDPGYVDFVTTVVNPEYQRLQDFASQLEKILTTEKYSISVTWNVSNSDDETNNTELLNDYRLQSVITYLKQYNGGILEKYINNSKLILGGTATKTTTVSVKNGEYQCSSSVKENQYSCRSVRISSINITGQEPEKPTPPTPEKDINKLQTGLKPKPDNDPLNNLKQGLSKKVLRHLLSECDYFDVLEETSPMVYDSIREKIKYFNPTFHSMTPEGLNARLTFLQQCVRPGDTIPTINEDGTPRYDDAINTAFGTPPILVLRIGDFYHTKIVPTSLQINYEPLVFDLNPEGIGVQPMIANISLSFNFIGGSGLARPVEQLQNALSFNFYGNTEMYDERAESTEDTSKIDKDLFQQIIESQPPVTQPENKITNDGGNTITTILTSSGDSINLSGTTSLQKKMDELIDETQTYFDVITNQLRSVVESYNRGIMVTMSSDRDYTDGTLTPSSQVAPIYGKPINTQSLIDNLFSDEAQNIDNEQNYITKKLKELSFTDTILNDVKKNMKSYLEDYKQELSTGLFNIIQTMVTKQEKYVQNIRKLNFVSGLIDGKIDNKGVGVIYRLTPTTEVNPSSNGAANTFVEFSNDYIQIGQDLNDYNTFVNNNFINSYTPSTILFPTIEDRNFYLVATQIFADKSKMSGFIQKVTNNIQDIQQFRKKFENICDDLHSKFKKEYNSNLKYMDDLIKDESYKDFRKYKPFTKKKKRVFDFTSVPPGTPTEISDLQNLYKSYNIDNNSSTYLNKIKFN